MSRSRYSAELHDFVKSERELAYALRDSIERAVPFAPMPPDDLTPEMQRKMAESFARWSETWILPIAEQLAVRAGIPLAEFQASGHESNARRMARGEGWASDLEDTGQ